MNRTRPQEAEALLRQALRIALEHDRPSAALRAYSNLSANMYEIGSVRGIVPVLEEGAVFGERVVDRIWNNLLVTDAPVSLFMLGRWDEALGRVNDIGGAPGALPDAFGVVTLFPIIHISRGDMGAVAVLLETYDRYRTSSDAQERLAWVTGKAAQLNASGDHVGCAGHGPRGTRLGGDVGSEHHHRQDLPFRGGRRGVRDRAISTVRTSSSSWHKDFPSASRRSSARSPPARRRGSMRSTGTM